MRPRKNFFHRPFISFSFRSPAPLQIFGLSFPSQPVQQLLFQSCSQRNTLIMCRKHDSHIPGPFFFRIPQINSLHPGSIFTEKTFQPRIPGLYSCRQYLKIPFRIVQLPDMMIGQIKIHPGCILVHQTLQGSSGHSPYRGISPAIGHHNLISHFILIKLSRLRRNIPLISFPVRSTSPSQ